MHTMNETFVFLPSALLYLEPFLQNQVIRLCCFQTVIIFWSCKLFVIVSMRSFVLFRAISSEPALIRYMEKVVRKESARKPPRTARRKAVPMKLVTMLAEVDGEKCINFDRTINGNANHDHPYPIRLK